MRVSDPDKSTRQVLMFEVVRYRGHWRTLHNGKRSAPLADQTAAVFAAKKLARQRESEGHLVEVILRRTDGDSVTPIDQFRRVLLEIAPGLPAQ